MITVGIKFLGQHLFREVVHSNVSLGGDKKEWLGWMETDSFNDTFRFRERNLKRWISKIPLRGNLNEINFDRIISSISSGHLLEICFWITDVSQLLY